MTDDLTRSVRMLVLLCLQPLSLDDDQLEEVVRLMRNIGASGLNYGRGDLDADLAAFDSQQFGKVFAKVFPLARDGAGLLLRQYARAVFLVHGTLGTLPAGEIRFITQILQIPEYSVDRELRETAQYVADEFNTARSGGLPEITAEQVIDFLDGKTYLVPPDRDGSAT